MDKRKIKLRHNLAQNYDSFQLQSLSQSLNKNVYGFKKHI